MARCARDARVIVALAAAIAGGWWPLTVSADPPPVKQAKLLAPNYTFHAFGAALDLDGDVLVVGAPFTDVYYPGSQNGSALVFRFGGTGWVQQDFQTVQFQDGQQFGNSVAQSGSTALVGSRWLDAVSAETAGAVYAFHWNGGNGTAWIYQQTLVADDAQAFDNFGSAVAFDGDVALVGARGADQNGADSGSAYVFRRVGGVWTEQQRLEASDGAGGDWFGYSLSMDEDVLVIGAHYNGPGAAYAFRWNGSAWVEEQKLLPTRTTGFPYFGVSVAVHQNVIVVGATGDDETAPNAGAAYQFRWNGETWMLERKLLAPDGEELDGFGAAVALTQDAVAIGAPGDDSGGSVYIFDVADTGKLLAEVPSLGTEAWILAFVLLAAFGTALLGDRRAALPRSR